MDDEKLGFEKLSSQEKEVVGTADDYAWDEAITLPARRRPQTVQFSLRLDRATYIELRSISRRRGMTFSEVAREGLAAFVATADTPAVNNLQISFAPGSGVLVQIAGGRAELSGGSLAAEHDDQFNLAAV